MKCKIFIVHIFLILNSTFLISNSLKAQMFWNQACSFAGTSSSYVSVRNTPTINITGSFTLEAWINPGSLTGNSKGIFGKGGALGTAMIYGIRLRSSGRIEVATNGVLRLVSKTSSTVPINQWTHIAATYNASTNLFSLYLNGVLDTSSTVAGASPISNIDSLFIGISSATTPYSGIMDEVRIWNRAVSIIDVIRNMKLSLGTNSGYHYNGLILSMTFQKENSAGVQFTANDWSNNQNFGLKIGVSQVNLSDLPSKTIATSLCLDFSFGNDYLSGPDNAAISPTTGITLQAWIYPRANFDRSIIHKGPATGGVATNYSLNIINQKLAAKINGGTYDSQDTLPLNQWSHVAFSYWYDGLLKYYNFYVNGKRVRGGFSFGGSNITDGSDSLYIGGTGFLTSFSGYIDEVRISPYSKSQGEINDSIFVPMENGNVTPSRTVAYNFDGYTYCNSLIGPFLYFRNSPVFINPSIYSAYIVSPLNKGYSTQFQKGFYMKTSERRIPATGVTGNMTEDKLNILLDETILDLNVFIGLNHTNTSDLQVSLIGPEGNSVQLMNSNSLLSPGDHVVTVFDDQAASPMANNTYISFSPIIKPLNNMNSMFGGTNSKGLWRLTISDISGNDTGRLYGWGIQINNKFILPSIVSSNNLIQGFYNSSTNTMIRDTVKCYLRYNYSPYLLVDSSKTYVKSDGTCSFLFTGQNILKNIPYFLQLKHRNSIETWSSGAVSFELLTSQAAYDFTVDNTNAFGNNLIQADNSPIKFAIYSGDVTQDGTVDATDLSQIDNDAANFTTGYVVTDLTGDNFVDATDVAIADNNAANFVSIVRP